MKKTYKILSLLCVFTLVLTFRALAIDNDGGIVDDVPLDGGLSLLVAAGVGYGAKKAKERRDRKNINI
jgi:hypothetical protein